MSAPSRATFAELGVSQPLIDALDRDGIENPFPIQDLVIPDGLAGRDICGKARTGSGKTLAFGIPLVERTTQAAPQRPHALVLVPTRELAQQVTDVLRPLAKAQGLSACAIYGGGSMKTQGERLRKGVDIVVATPGRLIAFCDDGTVDLDEVEYVVVDEADRMADMGFLPQVEWLLRRLEGKPQAMLFSATLDRGIGRLADRYLNDPVFHEVEPEKKTVETMRYFFFEVHEMDRVRVVAAISEGVDRMLVFDRTKRGVDRLTRRLRDEGCQARAIHGDLNQSQRDKALADFTEGKIKVLVATDVAARGIDVEDVDVVLHYDIPDDTKSYLHRSGRTARAGSSGIVVTFTLYNEKLAVKRLKRILKVDEPIIEVFSSDERLRDLDAWDPKQDEAVA